MRIKYTCDELRALDDKRHRDYVASLPEPKVVNVEAVVAFGHPRQFAWGGVGYRAPPVSYRDGLRLLIAANALRDIRGASHAHPSTVAYAIRTAVYLVRSAVVPVAWHRRLLWPRWSRAFLDLEPLELEGLLRWLHDAPDESPPPDPGDAKAPPPDVDLIDGLANFAREFPAWVALDGFPLSWRHYCYGLRHLARARAREDLRTAIAVRMPQTDKRTWDGWFADERRAAGW